MIVDYYENINGVMVAKGLSTDTKPSGPPDNAIFIELDTGLNYKAFGGNWSVPNTCVAYNANQTAANAVTQLSSQAYAFNGSLQNDAATGANVTPISLTGLSFSFLANSKYKIWGFGQVQPGAATTGCSFQFDVSVAVNQISIITDHPLANTGTSSMGYSVADDTSAGVTSGMPSTLVYPVRVEGIIITGANPGTAQLRFRSETTAITTCKAGFVLIVEKL